MSGNGRKLSRAWLVVLGGVGVATVLVAIVFPVPRTTPERLGATPAGQPATARPHTPATQATPQAPSSARVQAANSVVRRLYDAWNRDDRSAAARVATDRVIRLLFGDLPNRANPDANSLGGGPEPCVGSRNEAICYFRNSVVKVIVKRNKAVDAIYPLGIGTWTQP